METNAPRADHYDVVVVGSGLGGISAAALLARAGMKVLVVERQEGPGGYAHAFERGPYTLDPAVHYSAQGGPGQLYQEVLAYLGVEHLCTFLAIPSAYGVTFAGTMFDLPLGVEEFIDAHVRYFPGEAEGIREFFRICLRMHRDIHQLSMQLSLQKLEEAIDRYPVLFKYRTATLAEVLDEYLSDPRVKAVCAASWPYAGLPPSRYSFFQFAQVLMNQLEGQHFPRGGFGRFAGALAAAVEQNAGELLYNTQATRILIEDGRVVGVTLDDGTQISTSMVISNADARQTFDTLVGTEHLPPAFVRRLLRMTPSFSAFVLFTATTLDLRQFDPPHETFVNLTWDHEDAYRDILAGKPGGMWLNVPTLIDPSLAPPGEHLVIVTSLAEYDIGVPWDQEKEHFTELLLEQLEAAYPGTRDQLVFTESATPLVLERYTLNYRGAAYGWENTPAQTGTKRPAHQTPIPGLYLSGHWSQPGTAALRVFASGLHTAYIVLADAGRAGAAPAFQQAGLPSVT